MAIGLVLLLQVAAASPRTSPRSAALTSAAQASGRPAECAAFTQPRSHWDAARDPDVDRYCDLLARGLGELPFAPDTARDRADAADRVSPGHAGPAVLRGRAYAALKDYPHALAELERARAIDARSLDDPATMRDLARVLGRLGRASDALAVYRTLGPRLALLPSTDERARTFLEGAELAFSLGPSALDDAIAFLTEAKPLAVRELQWRIASELALALDRKGRKEEAASLVLDLALRTRILSPTSRISEEVRKPSTATPDEQAAIAMVVEATNPSSAPAAWEKYLAAVSDESPWREHARKRLEALKRKGGGR